MRSTLDATIKITKQELDRVGQPSIALRDGSGYIAELGVFHELHCLVRLSTKPKLDDAEKKAAEAS